MTLRPEHGANEIGALRRTEVKYGIDKGAFVCFLMLLMTGLVVLYAASYYNAQNTGSSLSDVYSQLMGIALGAAAMVLIMRIDYHWLAESKVCVALLVVSFIMLVLVAIPGIGVYLNGSRRWLRLGPISFQPSELAKYAMILYMAKALSGRHNRTNKFFTGLVPLFIVPGIMFMLILLQPNLSTAGCILIVAAVMAMLAGAKWRHMGMIGIAGGILAVYYTLSEDYRRERLMSFVDPFKYLTDEGYQLSQSLMAFGSGGMFGMGLGQGRQKFAFLPYPESDFIFAVVGEDMGFIGCALVLIMFAGFVFFGLRIAFRCEDRFGSLLAAGITCMIGVQVILNVAVVTGMMPTTGLPLPFFSAGGTSIAIVMGAVALLLNISRSVPRI